MRNIPLAVGNMERVVGVIWDENSRRFRVRWDAREFVVTVEWGAHVNISIGGLAIQAVALATDDTVFVHAHGRGTIFWRPRSRETRSRSENRVTAVRAPIPCRIAAIAVETGSEVTRAIPLVIVEAMKMELTIVAPCDGKIGAVYHRDGEQVPGGVELLELVPCG